MYNVSDIFDDSLSAFRYAMHLYHVVSTDPLAYKKVENVGNVRENPGVIELDESQFEVLN